MRATLALGTSRFDLPKLKGLEKAIDVSFVHWYMAEQGWTFNKDEQGIVGDHLFDLEFAHQLYTMADKNYTGRVTVPVLWDKDQNTIVSNESSEIIRMLNSAFDDNGANDGDYYPAHLQDEIDKINHRIYHTVNNGVYKSGFSTTREAYKEAVYPLFETLDWLENRLGNMRFLHGNTPYESDWRLFPTLYRFDSIYHSHFKCSIKRIVDYPNLWGYTRDLYQWPGIVQTVNMKHARNHYYESHETINPTRIVPICQTLTGMSLATEIRFFNVDDSLSSLPKFKHHNFSISYNRNRLLKC